MQKFDQLTGVAAPLPVVNIDTDMIIPKDYLKTIKRTGLGTGLFAEARYNEDGSENPDFVLNKPAYRDAKILVAGDNFGCGSSREHAPWALMDFGIRCVISTSFGDIFYNNCFKNGLLPVILPGPAVTDLRKQLHERPGATITVDLERPQRLHGRGNVALHHAARTVEAAGSRIGAVVPLDEAADRIALQASASAVWVELTRDGRLRIAFGAVAAGAIAQNELGVRRHGDRAAMAEHDHVVPHAELHYLPFAALVDDGGQLRTDLVRRDDGDLPFNNTVFPELFDTAQTSRR